MATAAKTEAELAMVYRRNKLPKAASISPGNGKGKLRLLTRDALDGRTRACREFDATFSGICNDLGGIDRMSTIDIALAEAFSSLRTMFKDSNAHMLLGETIDHAEHTQTVTSMVRVASRLPTGRVAKDITPTIGHLIREEQEAERERLAAEQDRRRQTNEAAE